MTVQQFQDKLAAKAAEIAKVNLPLKIAAQTVHAFRVKRIFHDGIAGASYNTTRELWVEDDKLRRRGPHRGKTGKPTKTSYFRNYAALKQQQGFNPSVVNLRLTNNLQSDFANVNLSSSDNSMPAAASPIKIDPSLWVERLDRQENLDKYKGLSRKYNNPFRFTKEERRLFKSIAQQEFIRLLKA